MVRKIILIRHGESADKQAGQMDFDRVLSERGRTSVQELGRYLKHENIFPDCIFSSRAVRAYQTASILASEIGKADIEIVESLYHGDDSEYLNVILHSIGMIVIVGHNPAIGVVAGRLCKNYGISLSPGQAAILEIDGNDPEAMSGKLLKSVGPMR